MLFAGPSGVYGLRIADGAGVGYFFEMRNYGNDGIFINMLNYFKQVILYIICSKLLKRKCIVSG